MTVSEFNILSVFLKARKLLTDLIGQNEIMWATKHVSLIGRIDLNVWGLASQHCLFCAKIKTTVYKLYIRNFLKLSYTYVWDFCIVSKYLCIRFLPSDRLKWEVQIKRKSCLSFMTRKAINFSGRFLPLEAQGNGPFQMGNAKLPKPKFPETSNKTNSLISPK